MNLLPSGDPAHGWLLPQLSRRLPSIRIGADGFEQKRLGVQSRAALKQQGRKLDLTGQHGDLQGGAALPIACIQPGSVIDEQAGADQPPALGRYV